MRLSPCVLVQPDGWARGEREGYGGPRDVTSLSLKKHASRRVNAVAARTGEVCREKLSPQTQPTHA